MFHFGYNFTVIQKKFKRKYIMKRKLFTSVIACGLLFASSSIQAKTDTKKLVQKELKKSRKTFKQAPKEILDGLTESSKAMQSLVEKKSDAAKKHLQNAIANFDKALKSDPSLDIIPIDERIDTYANLSPNEEIEKAIKLAGELVKNHRLSEARVALAPLRDEMIIKTVSMPIKVFPIAAKDALKALKKGDDKKAVALLAEGYSTLVIEEVLIPIPLLEAQDFMIEAALLGKDKEEASKLLDAASDALDRATLFGYTSKYAPEYKVLHEDIKTIQKELKGKNPVVKLFDKLKEKFTSLLHKHEAKHEVENYQKKEAVKALKERKIFKNDAKSDAEKTIKK